MYNILFKLSGHKFQAGKDSSIYDLVHLKEKKQINNVIYFLN